MQLIPGKQLAGIINQQTKEDVSKRGVAPGLALLRANNDPASAKYIQLKMAKAESLGIHCQLVEFPESVTSAELITHIQELNKDPAVSGILMQLPLFDHLKTETRTILDSIQLDKDVDGLTSGSLANLLAGHGQLPAAVAATIECLRYVAATQNMELMDYLRGKHCVVVNHSDLIGKPLALWLLQQDAIVTVAHQAAVNLGDLTKQASVLITAAGVPGLITAQMVQEDSVVIDITSVRTDSGQVVGDVTADDELKAKVGFLTPVPGGIGPLTVACLLRSVANAAKAVQASLSATNPT